MHVTLPTDAAGQSTEEGFQTQAEGRRRHGAWRGSWTAGKEKLSRKEAMHAEMRSYLGAGRRVPAPAPGAQ